MSDYLVAHLGQHYAILKQEIFALPRYLGICDNPALGPVIECESLEPMPNYVTAPAGTLRNVVCIKLFAVGELSITTDTIASYTHHNGVLVASKTGTIAASLKDRPPFRILEARRKALERAYRAVSECCSWAGVGEMLMACDHKPTFQAIWIPTLDALSLKVNPELPPPVKRDPALILTLFDTRYIIDTWAAPDEKPFEKFLQQYTVPGTPVSK